MRLFITRCLLLLLAWGLFGCGSSTAKPQTKTELPSLVFADRYALLIARHQYEKAAAVSTPENIKMINIEVKPFLNELAVQNHCTNLSFKEVQFLSAQLVKGDEGHLLVMEALVPSPLLANGERILLSFEVRKKDSSFEVSSSHVRIYSGEEPW